MEIKKQQLLSISRAIFTIWLASLHAPDYLLSQNQILDLKGPLLYQNTLSSEREVHEWAMEGPGKVEFRDGWMHMFSPEEEGHHVFWCPFDFPSSFIAEWEMENQELDAGLCIIFFAAAGANGEDIFEENLKSRDGVFSGYTKSDINNYHISYYANTPNNPDRPYAHLRKNSGFHKVMVGGAPIPVESTRIHHLKLVKNNEHILMFIDDRKIIDWHDDGLSYGPTLGGGKIGFRQMQWTHFKYRNFQVWGIKGDSSDYDFPWDLHVIDDGSMGADGVKLDDVNADQLKDIVTGWEEGGITKMYIHPALELVRQRWPAVTVGNTPAVEDATFADLDGDGMLDIVSSTEGKEKTIFVHWGPKKGYLQKDLWMQEPLPRSRQLMQWMYAESLQVDHKHGIDLIAAGKGEGAALGWFEAPERARDLSQWTWHKISDVGWIMSIIIHDIDADGDQDVIITDRKGELQGCRWLENPGPGDEQIAEWQNHWIGARNQEVMFMDVANLNSEDRMEIILVERSDQNIYILSQEDSKGIEWKEKVVPLPEQIVNAKAISAGDLDLDGFVDLVISSNSEGYPRNGIVWVSAKDLDSPEPAFLPISAQLQAKYDRMVLHDIDGDGDLDILTCEENYGTKSQGLGVIWFENPTKPH